MAPTQASATFDAVNAARSGARIDRAQLASLDCERLWVTRGWIYARHGLDFTTRRGQDYFSAQPEYVRKPGLTLKAVTALLTPTDRSNLTLVMQAETARRCK